MNQRLKHAKRHNGPWASGLPSCPPGPNVTAPNQSASESPRPSYFLFIGLSRIILLSAPHKDVFNTVSELKMGQCSPHRARWGSPEQGSCTRSRCTVFQGRGAINHKVPGGLGTKIVMEIACPWTSLGLTMKNTHGFGLY